MARGRRLKLAEMTGEPLLSREAGSGTRAAAEQAFAAQGIEGLPLMALGSNEAVKHAIRPRLGLAVLSVAGFPLHLQWHFVWRQDRALSLPARTLFDDPRTRLHVKARPSGHFEVPASVIFGDRARTGDDGITHRLMWSFVEPPQVLERRSSPDNPCTYKPAHTI